MEEPDCVTRFMADQRAIGEEDIGVVLESNILLITSVAVQRVVTPGKSYGRTLKAN